MDTSSTLFISTVEPHGAVSTSAVTVVEPAEKGGSSPLNKQSSAEQHEQYPDGGLESWKVVLGAWLVSFSTWGYISAFGVYQQYYQAHQLSTRSPSDISWIGSLQLAMILWGGVPMGHLFDHGYLRSIMICGTIWTVFCLMMTSLAKSFYQVLLAQGFGLGLGLGMIYLPAILCVSHWFRARRAFANGVAGTGSSIGGICYPIILNNLANNPSVGFDWTVRTTAFLTLAALVTAIFLLKTRLPPRQTPGHVIDFSVYKDMSFTLFCAGMWFVQFGLYFPFFYLQEYAIIKGIDQKIAFYLIATLNAGSVFGRTVPNYLADRIGPLNVLAFACAVSGIMIFTFAALKSVASFFIFAVIFGAASGTYVSCIPPCIASLTNDIGNIGLRLAMAFLLVGFSALSGTPIDGALIKESGKFWGSAVFSGLSVMVGVVLLLITRIYHSRVKLTTMA